jgi:hypothetical protein
MNPRAIRGRSAIQLVRQRVDAPSPAHQLPERAARRARSVHANLAGPAREAALHARAGPGRATVHAVAQRIDASSAAEELAGAAERRADTVDASMPRIARAAASTAVGLVRAHVGAERRRAGAATVRRRSGARADAALADLSPRTGDSRVRAETVRRGAAVGLVSLGVDASGAAGQLSRGAGGRTGPADTDATRAAGDPARAAVQVVGSRIDAARSADHGAASAVGLGDAAAAGGKDGPGCERERLDEPFGAKGTPTQSCYAASTPHRWPRGAARSMAAPGLGRDMTVAPFVR